MRERNLSNPNIPEKFHRPHFEATLWYDACAAFRNGDALKALQLTDEFKKVHRLCNNCDMAVYPRDFDESVHLCIDCKEFKEDLRPCYRCANRLPESWFDKASNTSGRNNGKGSICKLCRSKINREYWKKRKKAGTISRKCKKRVKLNAPIPEVARCTKCCDYKEAIHFHKNSYSTNGLSYWCKDCTKRWTNYPTRKPEYLKKHRERQKALRLKKKLEKQAAASTEVVTPAFQNQTELPSDINIEIGQEYVPHIESLENLLSHVEQELHNDASFSDPT